MAIGAANTQVSQDVGRNRRAALPGQRIDRPFEGERHRDGGELGAEQQQRRPRPRALQVAPVRRPDVGPQPRKRAQQRAAVGGDVALHRARSDGDQSSGPGR